MESLGVKPPFWAGKRVFITGHTGFKGSWLALWLQAMGAQVFGYALEPPTKNNLFTIAGAESGMARHVIADIRDSESLKSAVLSASPEIILHLAAQPLVRRSYADPVKTYATNVMGTVNLLEAARSCPAVRAVVNVTTDKCYENREWVWPYRENEPMGGCDPYSSSKACSELITAAYRRAFFNTAKVGVATARAGNVIGGGDWALDRLVPDILRSIDAGEKLMIRSPQAIRPWQHVLEPLSGYLVLAEHLFREGSVYAEPWNFGPANEDARTVQWIVEYLATLCPNVEWGCDRASRPHEAHCLKLDSAKAQALLGWRCRWPLEKALRKTVEWHGAWRQRSDMREVTLGQIGEYQRGVDQER